MKRAMRIIGAVLVIALIGVIIFLKTVVGGKSIYISTGFEKDVMIKVDQTQTSRLEVMAHLSDMIDEYEELFGEDIWTETMDGVPFDEYVIRQVKSKLTRIKCMNQVALSRGIVLSNQEEQNIGKAAAEYVAGIDKASVKKYDITEEAVKDMYRSMLMADKLFDDLTYEVDTEISEDEARVITIQYIKADTPEAAASIKSRLDGGESFSSLMKENNPYEYEYELRRGEMEEAFEEAAFNLVTGEISNVVETSKGYYIIMCVNEYDKVKTAVNKEKMISESKLEKFNEIFEPYEAELYAEYNDELWEKLSVEDRIVTTAGFQDTYDKYFK
ncbi:MAG: peptidyl-prolyl cis-trans isomerase [Thermoflexaceae bacterium]|nr:peptidyl-prolyl cis-trans isomerase [Thermoflexaceae bacterium]